MVLEFMSLRIFFKKKFASCSRLCNTEESLQAKCTVCENEIISEQVFAGFCLRPASSGSPFSHIQIINISGNMC